MTRGIRNVIGVVGLVVATGIGWVLLPSEEDRIRWQLDDLAETVSVEAGELLVIRRARAVRIANYFTEYARVDLGWSFEPLQGREAVTAVAAEFRLPLEGIKVTILDTSIRVDGSSTGAIAAMTAQVSTRAVARDAALEVREVAVRLRKVNGEWLVDDMRAVDADRRPPP